MVLKQSPRSQRILLEGQACFVGLKALEGFRFICRKLGMQVFGRIWQDIGTIMGSNRRAIKAIMVTRCFW